MTRMLTHLDTTSKPLMATWPSPANSTKEKDRSLGIPPPFVGIGQRIWQSTDKKNKIPRLGGGFCVILVKDFEPDTLTLERK